MRYISSLYFGYKVEGGCEKGDSFFVDSVGELVGCVFLYLNFRVCGK